MPSVDGHGRSALLSSATSIHGRQRSPTPLTEREITVELVTSTARFAHELGFNVTLALDAITDMSQEAHDNSVTRIFPRLGETGSSRDIIAQLERA